MMRRNRGTARRPGDGRQKIENVFRTRRGLCTGRRLDWPAGLALAIIIVTVLGLVAWPFLAFGVQDRPGWQSEGVVVADDIDIDNGEFTINDGNGLVLHVDPESTMWGFLSANVNQTVRLTIAPLKNKTLAK